jgi:hypothetical protein
MKTSAGIIATLLIALPLFARPPLSARMKSITVREPQTQSVSADVAAQILSQWRAQMIAHRSSNTVHASAVTDVRSARAFVIPAAGSAPGGGGALFFRSDVTLVNYDSTAQDVVAVWWASGTSNPLATSGSTVTRLTLQPFTFNTYPDFVATTLHQSGLGSVAVIPVSGNSFDFAAGIDGFSRIFTKQPGSNGTVSQEFPGVDPDSLSIFTEGVSLGLRQDADYRTNWGIVNVDDVAHAFKVTFLGENNQSQSVNVTVPAFGMTQQPAPAGTFGALNIVFDVTDTNNFISWLAYASSTDNTTGDGWVSIASADYSSDDLDFLGF